LETSPAPTGGLVSPCSLAADEFQVATRSEVFYDSFQAETRHTWRSLWKPGRDAHGELLPPPGQGLSHYNHHPRQIIKRDIVVAELGPAFDQVVLLGHPPLLKDVIDQASSRH